MIDHHFWKQPNRDGQWRIVDPVKGATTNSTIAYMTDEIADETDGDGGWLSSKDASEIDAVRQRVAKLEGVREDLVAECIESWNEFVEDIREMVDGEPSADLAPVLVKYDPDA